MITNIILFHIEYVGLYFQLVKCHIISSWVFLFTPHLLNFTPQFKNNSIIHIYNYLYVPIFFLTPPPATTTPHFSLSLLFSSFPIQSQFRLPQWIKSSRLSNSVGNLSTQAVLNISISHYASLFCTCFKSRFSRLQTVIFEHVTVKLINDFRTNFKNIKK